MARAISLLAIAAITATLPAASQRAPSLPELARSVSPAVVLIATSDKNGNPLAEGSGFVVDANGLIATNLHVIKGAYSASVTLANGDTYDSVLVADADSRKDLALLQIKAVDLKFLRFGDSDSVQVGQHVVAVGNPEMLANSVSDGIVSAVRQLEGMRLLQITVPISHGSSGGPLLNDGGEVIGVTKATYSEGQNLNFAVPANYLKPMIRFLDRSVMRPLSEFNAESLETAEPAKKTEESKNEPMRADVALDGAWSATIADAKGSAMVQFNLIESSDGDVAGTYTTSLGGGGQIRGSLKDSQFTFELKQTLQNCTGIFKGTAKVEVGKAVGTYTGTDCLGDHGNGSLTMTKRGGSGGQAESAKAPDVHPKIEENAPTGSYTGVWQSSKFAVSGAAQMRIRIAEGTANAEIFLTGGEVTSANLNGIAHKTGENIWTVHLSSQKPRLSVRGIFRGNSFVGDYTYSRFLMLDHGQWILKKE